MSDSCWDFHFTLHIGPINVCGVDLYFVLHTGLISALGLIFTIYVYDTHWAKTIVESGYMMSFLTKTRPKGLLGP